MAKASEIIGARTEEPQGILDKFFAIRQQALQRRRERQISEALSALEEMKAINEANPTAKRTNMIKSLEERYRSNGILR